MTGVLSQFKELEDMANNIIAKRNQIQQEDMKKRKQTGASKVLKEFTKTKKEVLESQIYCQDGPFLVVVLLELNTFYSISKKMDIAIMISLDSFPREVIQGLLDAIGRKRNNPNSKTKLSITETFLQYIYDKQLNNTLKVYNLQKDLIIDNKIFEIMDAHNMRRKR